MSHLLNKLKSLPFLRFSFRERTPVESKISCVPLVSTKVFLDLINWRSWLQHIINNINHKITTPYLTVKRYDQRCRLLLTILQIPVWWKIMHIAFFRPHSIKQNVKVMEKNYYFACLRQLIRMGPFWERIGTFWQSSKIDLTMTKHKNKKNYTHYCFKQSMISEGLKTEYRKWMHKNRSKIVTKNSLQEMKTLNF